MIHEFSNGVRLPREDLLDLQVERYTAPGKPNLHEPLEEGWLLEALPEDGVFVDVGAAVGYYSILAKRLHGNLRVVAFEPLPRHAAALRRNLELNGLAPDAVEVRELAIGRHSGLGTLSDEGYSSALSSTGIVVRMATMSEAVADLRRVDVLKMDVQGAELELLGDMPSFVKHLLVGTHSRTLHEQAKAVMTAKGYDILFDDVAPPMQPDGLIVGALPDR